MGTVDTWWKYRQGDCLRERGPLLLWPHLFLSIWAQPSTLSPSFQFPVPVPALRGRGTRYKWRKAGGRREEGPSVLACAHLSNLKGP